MVAGGTQEKKEGEVVAVGAGSVIVTLLRKPQWNDTIGFDFNAA